MLLLKLNHHIWRHYEINQRVNYLYNPLHLDRLNIAYVRAPNPGNFFLPRVTTHDRNIQDDQPPNADLIKLNVPTNHEADSSFILNSIAAEQGTESISLSELDEPSEPVIQRRPKRQIEKPACFQTNESNYNETTSETESTFYKIKRILAQRKRDKPEPANQRTSPKRCMDDF